MLKLFVIMTGRKSLDFVLGSCRSALCGRRVVARGRGHRKTAHIRRHRREKAQGDTEREHVRRVWTHLENQGKFRLGRSEKTCLHRPSLGRVEGKVLVLIILLFLNACVSN